MILLVTASRYLTSMPVFEAALVMACASWRIRPRDIIMVWQGGARGGDALARDWAKKHGRRFKTFKADWNKWGKGAGPRRNTAMVQAALLESEEVKVLAIPLKGGANDGTRDCYTKAHNKGLGCHLHLAPPWAGKIEGAVRANRRWP